MDDPKDGIKLGQCTDANIVEIELACKLKHEQTWNISETQFVAKSSYLTVTALLQGKITFNIWVLEGTNRDFLFSYLLQK